MFSKFYLLNSLHQYVNEVTHGISIIYCIFWNSNEILHNMHGTENFLSKRSQLCILWYSSAQIPYCNEKMYVYIIIFGQLSVTCWRQLVKFILLIITISLKRPGRFFKISCNKQCDFMCRKLLAEDNGVAILLAIYTSLNIKRHGCGRRGLADFLKYPATSNTASCAGNYLQRTTGWLFF